MKKIQARMTQVSLVFSSNYSTFYDRVGFLHQEIAL